MPGGVRRLSGALVLRWTRRGGRRHHGPGRPVAASPVPRVGRPCLGSRRARTSSTRPSAVGFRAISVHGHRALSLGLGIVWQHVHARVAGTSFGCPSGRCPGPARTARKREITLARASAGGVLATSRPSCGRSAVRPADDVAHVGADDAGDGAPVEVRRSSKSIWHRTPSSVPSGMSRRATDQDGPRGARRYASS